MNNILTKTLIIPALCISFSATANSTPKIFGTLNFGVQKIDNQSDIDGEAFEASIGIKGRYKVDDFTLIYKLETELAQAANMDDGQSEVKVKNALMALPTQVGTFIIAPRVESGQQKDMYQMVDIFENNTADNSTLWGQADAATSVFAYKTPTFVNSYIVASVLTLNQRGTANNYNDNFVDALSLRAMHKSDNLYLGLGNVMVASEQTGASKNYNRSSFTAGYTSDQIQLGMTLEHQGDHPSGSDTDLIGVAAGFTLGNGFSAGIGYTDRDSENNARDDAMLAFIARKDLADNIQAWVEVANYDEASDNYSAGIKVSL